MPTNNETKYDPARQATIDLEVPLLKAISAPHSGGGLLVAVNSICQCLKAAHALLPSVRAEEWVTNAHRLYRETKSCSALNFGMAVVASKESSRPVYSAFVDPAKCGISKDRLNRVNAMLGIAVIAAVSQEESVPPSFTDYWQTLRRACSGIGRRDSEWELLVKDLPITQEELKAFLKIATHAGVRRFVTDLLRMVAVAVALPAEPSTPEKPPAASETDEINDDVEPGNDSDEDQDLTGDSLKKQPPVAGKLIEWQMKGATFAPYAAKVGLLVSATRIPPADLKALCSKLNFGLQSTEDKTQRFAFAAIISIICSLPAQLAVDLPLFDNGDIYLLLEEKVVCWSYRKVLERRGKSSSEDSPSTTTAGLLRVPIPVPESVAAYGQLQLHLQPEAKTLGELLNVPKEKTERTLWLKEFGVFLKSCGDDVYPALPARTARSLPYVYLQQTGQDLAAAMLAFGFSTAASGMLHYINLNRAQIEKYVKQVYDYLGLGPAAPLPSSFDACGSSHAPDPEVFTAGWNKMMQDIYDSLQSARQAITDEDFLHSFNQFITLSLTAVVTLTAHRAQLLQRLTFGALFSFLSAVYFADKDWANGVNSRMAPKTQLLTEILEYYAENIRILAKQVKARGLTCAVLDEIADGIHRFDRTAFFHIELKDHKDGAKKLRRVQCTPDHIEKCTQHYFGKKRNCGRHFWVVQGCRRSFDRWVLRVLTGHSRQDAEPFHEFGLVAPNLALEILKREMDKYITELGLKGPPQLTDRAKKTQSSGQFAILPLPKSYTASEIRKPKIAGGQATHQRNLFTSRSLPAISLIDSVRSKLIHQPGNLTPGAGLLLHFSCVDGVTNPHDLKQVFQDLNKHLLHINGKPVLCFTRVDSAQEITFPVQPPTEIYLKTHCPDFEHINWQQSVTESAQWLREGFANCAWPSAPGRCLDTLLVCLNHWANFYLPPTFNSCYNPESIASTFSRLSVLRLAGAEKPACVIAFPPWTTQSAEIYQERNQSLIDVLKLLNQFADTDKHRGQNFIRAKHLEAELSGLPTYFTGGPAHTVMRSIRHEVEKILRGDPDRLELSSLATYMSALRPTLEAIPAYLTLDSFLADDWYAFYAAATYIEVPKKTDEATNKQLKFLKDDRITAANRFLRSLHELKYQIPHYLFERRGRKNSLESMRRPASSVYIDDEVVKSISDLLTVGLSEYPAHIARAKLKLQLLAQAAPLRYGNSAALPISCLTSNAGCLVIRDEGFSVTKSKRHQLIPVDKQVQDQIGELGGMLLAADHDAQFLFLKSEAVHDLASDGWLHDLLTTLLQLTTGDSTARTHNFRARVFSEHAINGWSIKVHELLTGNAGPRACLSLFSSADQLWISFPKASAEALHASRQTGAMYYLACWSFLRAAALSATLVDTPPPANLPTALGFSEGLMRKARQRHKTDSTIFDPWQWLSKKLKFENLAPYVASVVTEVPTASTSDPQADLEAPTFEKSIVYCARRMLNQTTNATQTLLGLPTSLVALLDSKLPSIETTLKLRERINSGIEGRAVKADIRALESPDAKIFISDRPGNPLPHDSLLLSLLSSTPCTDPSTWKDEAAAHGLLDAALKSLPKHLSLEVSFGERHFTAAVVASFTSHSRVVVFKNGLRDLGSTPQVRVIHTKSKSRTHVNKARLTTLIRILLQAVLIVQSIKK